MLDDKVHFEKQLALVPIAAFTAIGELHQLNISLKEGLDAGLTVSEIKEVLVQMYAYVGFPRCINAVAELMKVLNERKQQGITDAPGLAASAVPVGRELLALGTANQTKLVGAAVKGALSEFAPALDVYLKTHLFGDIFARDNLDWTSRELATVGALATMKGAESQLQSHLHISMNIGLTEVQLRQVIHVLGVKVNDDIAHRATEVLNKH